MSSDSTAIPAEGSSGNGKRRKALTILALVFVVIGAAWLLYWLLVLSKRERTDDAYVSGNQVSVSAQISGTVIAILAGDTDLVQAGQVLARLDPIDADNNLQKAANALAQAVRQFSETQVQAAQYDALVQNRRAELKRAQVDLERREPLLEQQAIAPEEVRHARTTVEVAQAALQQAEHQAAAAHALVDGTDARTNPAVLQAKNTYVDAWIAAQRNAVLAPVTGQVALRNVQLGQHIEPGQTLMNIVPLNRLWVDANFKEPQLRNLRIGQPATVVSDLYGGSTAFHGRVRGLGAGTGAAFSLLPAQNASGNWIKVVQRVPVRIELDAQELQSHPLRIGLSTTVTVDTTDRSGLIVPSAPVQSVTPDSTVYSRDLNQANALAEAIIAANLPKH